MKAILIGSGGGVDKRDYDVLQRIRQGDRVFMPNDGEAPSNDAWVGLVERLIRLSDQGFVRMSTPARSHQTAAGGYLVAGPCELTIEGRNALEQHNTQAR